jgi:hypothetical protein
MDFASGYLLDGAGSSVVQRRVFEPNGVIVARVPSTDPGTLLFGLGSQAVPGRDTTRPIWNLEFAAPRGERLRVGPYTFEHFCEGNPRNLTRGWVRFSP